MIQTMSTAWLYAYSPNADTPSFVYHTVYTGDPNGRAIFATVSLSYLTTLSTLGAGAWIRSHATFRSARRVPRLRGQLVLCPAGDIGDLRSVGPRSRGLCAGQCFLFLRARIVARKPKSSMTLLEGAGPLQPAAAVILYRRTGVIFSTHYFSATNDAKLPNKKSWSEWPYSMLRRTAAKQACTALHVDPTALKRGVGYRVAKGVLTEIKAGRLTPKPLRADKSSR